MNKQIVKINNIDLSVKELKGQRVVTFKDIDMLHERVEGTAGRNFRENKNHLIEDEDYFSIRGSELREFKQATNFVGSNAKEIILITESGYLMLVKSLQDDLAWKVQRELVNNYFRVKSGQPRSSLDLLELQVKALKEVKGEVQEVRNDFEEFKGNSPLFNIECKELQSLVRSVGTKALGGKGSAAYKDKSIRGKVYADIQHQLRREFQVNRYEAIKRNQLEIAKNIVNDYKLPIVLKDMIILKNEQIGIDEVI